MRQLVSDEGLSEYVKVATVHRFQGGEMDAVVIGLVDGKPFESGKPLTDHKASLPAAAADTIRVKYDTSEFLDRLLLGDINSAGGNNHAICHSSFLPE